MNNRVRTMAGRIVLASAMTVTGAALPASAAADDVPRVVTVTGQGEVKVKPDMATITTGVTSEAPTAKAALAKNSSAMDSVLKALKAAGIDEDDIQTSDFSVSPVYSQVPQGQAGTPHIASYQVTNQVTARVKALSKLGTTLDALVQAGSNQISGVSFDLNDSKATLDEARRKAIRDAQDRANLYATAAGSSIGGVVQISETAIHAPVFKAFSGREAMAYDGSVPISAGQNTYSASITVTFELN